MPASSTTPLQASGSAAHLAAEVFLGATGVTMAHIPYKSDADMVREVTAGTVQLGIMGAANVAPAIKAGNVRGLAVTTPHRLPELPDVPTLAETGINALAELEPYTLHALVGPAGMPGPIVVRLNETINKISAMPDVESRMRKTLMLEPAASTPESLRAFVEKEVTKWAALGKRGEDQRLSWRSTRSFAYKAQLHGARVAMTIEMAKPTERAPAMFVNPGYPSTISARPARTRRLAA